MTDKEIELGVGIGNIKFGSSMEEIERVMGEPEEIEESDETDEFEHKAWNYWEEGFSFYFDREDDYRLSCIETANPEVSLWGNKVFEMTQDELMNLFQEKDLEQPSVEKMETGEVRLSYEKEMIDLYFEDDKLIVINFGVFINDDLEVNWPQ